MARRPVFVPNYDGALLVQECMVDFTWSPGMAESQKKKNIVSLHEAAQKIGVDRILEISSKSNDEVGRRLSAFSLKIDIDGSDFPLESVYQGSKVFEKAGPFPEIFSLEPRQAKRFMRDNDHGHLVRFELEEHSYQLNPKNAFYDWLYIRALAKHVSWIERNVSFDGYTDIEFNPEKQVNCQARAFAEFKSLAARSKLEIAVRDFAEFSSLLPAI